MYKKTTIAALSALTMLPLAQAQAADYAIDIKGQHAFIQFRIAHVGFSYILGDFESFDGSFSYDAEDPAASSAELEVDVTSLTTNHAERDKHILSGDFLDAGKYPTATFTSTGFESTGEGTGVLIGDLTLHGTTQSIEMPVTLVGEGEDPWGGYRAGFQGSTDLTLADYGIDMSRFPEAMQTVELYVTFEGIRQ